MNKSIFIAGALFTSLALNAVLFLKSGDHEAQVEKLAAAESDIAALRKRQIELEQAVKSKRSENTALTQQLNALRSQPAPPSDESTFHSDDNQPDSSRAEEPSDVAELPRIRDRRLLTRDQLIDAGFFDEEIDRILALEEQALEKIDAISNNPEERSRQAIRAVKVEQAKILRTELGDFSYEQYREARNLPTNVPILSLQESSAGAGAGLQTGDKIISYAGSRVFDISDLQSAVTEGYNGETVVVEVLRGNHQLALIMPRGKIGISSSSFPGFR